MAEEEELEYGMRIMPNRAGSFQAFTEHTQGRGWGIEKQPVEICSRDAVMIVGWRMIMMGIKERHPGEGSTLGRQRARR